MIQYGKIITYGLVKGGQDSPTWDWTRVTVSDQKVSALVFRLNALL